MFIDMIIVNVASAAFQIVINYTYVFTVWELLHFIQASSLAVCLLYEISV